MSLSNPQLPMGTLTGSEKLEAVTSLMKKLTEDLDSISLLPHQRDAALEELKIYGRDPRNADPIFTREGIDTLTRHACNSPSSTTSRNAFRVLCNTLLLKKETRQMFVDLGYEAKVCAKLKNDSRDDEFLISRIIFLTTYDTTIDLTALIRQHHLAEAIIRNLERHTKNASGGTIPTNPMEGMALTETLKLMFNITHYCPEESSAFNPAIAPVITLICETQTTKPLDSPKGSMVNALLNLDLGSKEAHSALFPSAEPNSVASRLIDLLQGSSKVYKDDDLEGNVTALVGVIRGVHEYAPEEVKKYIRGALLPTEEDRQQVLGRSGSLPSWLLKNSTNPLTPHLRDTISKLLFDMSDKDATTFVNNVGYGFASGFLFNNNLPVPQNASEAYSTAEQDSQRPVNPVTGQFLDRETQPNEPEMTEEEKEREAERLFVLFERLRANGIINVENPVTRAVQEGRFEELPDDYEEEKLD